MIEAAIAVRMSTLRAVRAELRAAKEENREPNAGARMAQKFLRNSTREGTMRVVDVGGVGICTFWATFDNPRVLERIDDLPSAIVLGAWEQNGLQVGQHFEGDDDELVVGTPTYPINHGMLLAAMPDVDELGTRPTEPYQAHRFQGWSARRYG